MGRSPTSSDPTKCICGKSRDLLLFIFAVCEGLFVFAIEAAPLVVSEVEQVSGFALVVAGSVQGSLHEFDFNFLDEILKGFFAKLLFSNGSEIFDRRCRCRSFDRSILIGFAWSRFSAFGFGDEFPVWVFERNRVQWCR